MNKKDKKFLSQLPGGIGANVIGGDLPTAIRVWKQDVKNSGKLQVLFAKQEFVPPSAARREVVNAAKYKEQFKNVASSRQKS